MTPQVLFQNRKPNRVATLDEYRGSGGYEALADALRKRTPAEICKAVLDSGLQGRGGAGFPTGRKWMGVPEGAPFPRYIISNIDEMEPGTFKDRMMTHIDPHMIIEGMALSGYAVSAERGIVFVRPAYESTARIFEREVRIAREAGFLGRNLLGSGFSFDIVVHRSGGRYICGEGTAQINAIEGLRPHPKQSPIRSTEKGLWNLPTVLDNLETLVNVPHIVRHGPEWFKGLARTKTASGTKLYCVSGKVNRPGCYELPHGDPPERDRRRPRRRHAARVGVQNLPARGGLDPVPRQEGFRRGDGLRVGQENGEPPRHGRGHRLRHRNLPRGGRPST